MKKICICLLITFFLVSCASTPPSAPPAAEDSITAISDPASGTDISQETPEPVQPEAVPPAPPTPSSGSTPKIGDDRIKPPELLPQDSIIFDEPALRFFPVQKEQKAAGAALPEQQANVLTPEPEPEKPPVSATENDANAESVVIPPADSSLAGEAWDMINTEPNNIQKQTDMNIAEITPPEIPLSTVLQIYEPVQTVPEVYTYMPSPQITDTPAVATPSRSVLIEKNQYVDVQYPGLGWVFLGDTTGLLGVGYYGRKLSDSGTVFTLRGLEPGTYVLHFAKQDMLSDTYIDDYLQVTVLEAKSSSPDRKLAPPYSEIPPAPAMTPSVATQEGSSADQSANSKQTASSATTAPSLTAPSATEPTQVNPAPLIQTNESSPKAASVIRNEPELAMASEPAVSSAVSTLNPQSTQNTPSQSTADQLLSQAEKALADGKPAEALQLLDDFFKKSVYNLDKGWYLRAQSYEANGETKNIKAALDAYKTLTQAYPASPLWKAANDRIQYINRFYFNIF